MCDLCAGMRGALPEQKVHDGWVAESRTPPGRKGRLMGGLQSWAMEFRPDAVGERVWKFHMMNPCWRKESQQWILEKSGEGRPSHTRRGPGLCSVFALPCGCAVGTLH